MKLVDKKGFVTTSKLLYNQGPIGSSIVLLKAQWLEMTFWRRQKSEKNS